MNTDSLCDICAGKYPEDSAIFVFGSNESGIHGAGAALHARQFHGAELSTGYGPRETSFAIPTKDWVVATLDLDSIAAYVRGFIRYAKLNSGKIFCVTRIGCGFAGYTDAQIAPMFANAPKNCFLPKEFRDVLALDS